MSEPQCTVIVTYEGSRNWRWYLNPSPVPAFGYKYIGYALTRWGAERAGKRYARKVVRDLKRGKADRFVIR